MAESKPSFIPAMNLWPAPPQPREHLFVRGIFFAHSGYSRHRAENRPFFAAQKPIFERKCSCDISRTSTPSTRIGRYRYRKSADQAHQRRFARASAPMMAAPPQDGG